MNLFCAACLSSGHFTLGAVYSQPLPRYCSISVRLFCATDLFFIRRRNIVLTFVWHSLSCIAHLSGWEAVEMFVRERHMRAPVQPCLRCGGGGGIGTRPNSRPAARDRMHPICHGSGRLASHSTLATARRRLRLRPDAQRRGDCLGGLAAQRRLPAPLPGQCCRSR